MTPSPREEMNNLPVSSSIERLVGSSIPVAITVRVVAPASKPSTCPRPFGPPLCSSTRNAFCPSWSRAVELIPFTDRDVDVTSLQSDGHWAVERPVRGPSRRKPIDEGYGQLISALIGRDQRALIRKVARLSDELRAIGKHKGFAR